MSDEAAEAAEAAEAYAESLAELTFNSKPIINSLTMIADELQSHAAAIVGVIESRVAAATADKKLPLLYLLDSICKNVGGAYIQAFSARLPSTVGASFLAAGPKMRTSIQNLVKTWTGVFSSDVVQQVTASLSATQPAAAGAAAGGPVDASASAQPKPSELPPREAPREPVAAAGSRKRSREAPDDLRREVGTLISRIGTHMTAQLPADSQLLGFVSRACALYTQIISRLPSESLEHAPLSAELEKMQRLHAQLQHAVETDGSGDAAGAGGGNSKPSAANEMAAVAPAGLAGVLWKIHEGRPLQCKTCGLRFAESGREELRKHMDVHFRRNMRGKAAGVAPPSRRWMLPVESWVAYVYDEAESLVAEKASTSIFDAIGGATTDADPSEPAPVPMMRAPSEVSRVVCARCGEQIEMFFDAAAAEWMLRDAVQEPAADGAASRFCHSACVA